MFNVFKKKESYWKVIFKDSKGVIKSAKIKADNYVDAYYQTKRIFNNADFIDTYKM